MGGHKMKPGITLRKVGSDDDPMLLEISSSDGRSLFCNSAYAAYNSLKELIGGLRNFRNHMHGGLYNIRFGDFGPEYAGGAFEARLHFQVPGKLFVTVRAESEWEPYKRAEVASSATLYMKSEPVLLDDFIEALRKLDGGESDEASFLCT
jgi:hypothetical protein